MGLPAKQEFQQLKDWKEGPWGNNILKIAVSLSCFLFFQRQRNICPTSLGFSGVIPCTRSSTLQQHATRERRAWLPQHRQTQLKGCLHSSFFFFFLQREERRPKTVCSCTLLAQPIALGQFTHPWCTADIKASLSSVCLPFLPCIAQGCFSIPPSNFCCGNPSVRRRVCIAGQTGAAQVCRAEALGRPASGQRCLAAGGCFAGLASCPTCLHVAWEPCSKALIASLWSVNAVNFYNNPSCWVVNCWFSLVNSCSQKLPGVEELV